MVHSAKNILESQGLCITRKSEAATMGSLGTRHGAKAKRTVEAFQSAFYNRDGRKARCAKGVLKGTVQDVGRQFWTTDWDSIYVANSKCNNDNVTAGE